MGNSTGYEDRQFLESSFFPGIPPLSDPMHIVVGCRHPDFSHRRTNANRALPGAPNPPACTIAIFALADTAGHSNAITLPAPFTKSDCDRRGVLQLTWKALWFG
jgi:hypothetical protein